MKQGDIFKVHTALRMVNDERHPWAPWHSRPTEFVTIDSLWRMDTTVSRLLQLNFQLLVIIDD